VGGWIIPFPLRTEIDASSSSLLRARDEEPSVPVTNASENSSYKELKKRVRGSRLR